MLQSRPLRILNIRYLERCFVKFGHVKKGRGDGGEPSSVDSSPNKSQRMDQGCR